MGPGHKEHNRVGWPVELVENLADNLADGMCRQWVLGERRGESGHYWIGGRSVYGTTTVGPRSTRQWA